MLSSQGPAYIGLETSLRMIGLILLFIHIMDFDNAGTLDLVLAAAKRKSRVPTMKVR